MADLAAAAAYPKLTRVQRAWVLGLLYSITGFHDPQVAEDVLGPHRFAYPGDATSTKGVSTWGWGTGPVGVVLAAQRRIDVKKQMQFAGRWKKWLKNNPIRITKPAKPQRYE